MPLQKVPLQLSCSTLLGTGRLLSGRGYKTSRMERRYKLVCLANKCILQSRKKFCFSGEKSCSMTAHTGYVDVLLIFNKKATKDFKMYLHCTKWTWSAKPELPGARITAARLVKAWPNKLWPFCCCVIHLNANVLPFVPSLVPLYAAAVSTPSLLSEVSAGPYCTGVFWGPILKELEGHGGQVGKLK